MADDTRDGRSEEYSYGSEDANARRGERAEADRQIVPPHIEVEAAHPKTVREREEEKLRRLAELEEEQRRKKEEEERQKELKLRRKKRRLITPGVVLVVGAIASITMFIMKFSNRKMLTWLLIILIIAWIAGSLIQYMFERFAIENDEVSDEGEVINKGLVETEEVKAEDNG
ncbi:MAG: hypothetical protein K6G12_00240 [Lachnospiraceae bacterium]|nr:hypothetical protein [Lachnospiraceae bacterium]